METKVNQAQIEQCIGKLMKYMEFHFQQNYIKELFQKW